MSALHDYLKRAEKFGPYSCLLLHLLLKAQHYVIADCTPNRRFRSTRFGIGSNWVKSKWSTLIWSWRKEFILLSVYAPPRAPHRKWEFVRRQINTVALNSRSSQYMHIYINNLVFPLIIWVSYMYIYSCVCISVQRTCRWGSVGQIGLHLVNSMGSVFLYIYCVEKQKQKQKRINTEIFSRFKM